MRLKRIGKLVSAALSAFVAASLAIGAIAPAAQAAPSQPTWAANATI